jgi:hypothetical protein
MRYAKKTNDGYIMSIGTGNGGTEITEAEYNEILAVIHNKPAATETTDYRLREDLTWEEYPIDPPDPDPEIDDTELLNILMGGAE